MRPETRYKLKTSRLLSATFALVLVTATCAYNREFPPPSGDFPLSTDSLEVLKAVQAEHGFAFLQVINAAYLSMALNWICHVSEEVLTKTVFLATDATAASALRRKKVRFVAERFDSGELLYGTRKYYSYMLWRTRIVESLLLKGVNVWIIESDATWFGDPSAQLERYTNYDVIAGQDGLLEQNNAEAGFLFLNSTPGTIKLWQKIRHRQETQLSTRWYSFQANSDAGNEMLLLQKYLSDVHWTFFDRHRFVSGLWYMNATFRANTAPVVIQNNWIRGNAAKILRAQRWSHWFLLENDLCPLKHGT